MKQPEYIDTKIRLLKKAKKLIKSGEEYYICFALEAASYESNLLGAYKVKDQLVSFIHKALDNCASLTSWQRKNGFIFRESEQIRKDRLDWIDWMIADYEKWGTK